MLTVTLEPKGRDATSVCPGPRKASRLYRDKQIIGVIIYGQEGQKFLLQLLILPAELALRVGLGRPLLLRLYRMVES